MNKSEILENLVDVVTDSLEKKFPTNNFRKRLHHAYQGKGEMPVQFFLKYLINLSRPMRDYLVDSSKKELTTLRLRLQQDQEVRSLREETFELIFWSLVNSYARPTMAVRASHHGVQHWIPHCYLKHFTKVKSYQRSESSKLRFTKVKLKKSRGTLIAAVETTGDALFAGDKKDPNAPIEELYLELFYSKIETGYSMTMMKLRQQESMNNWDRIAMQAFVAGHFLRVSPEETLTPYSRQQWNFYRGTVGAKNHLEKLFSLIEQITEYNHVDVHTAGRPIPLAPNHLPVFSVWQGKEAFYFPISHGLAVVFSHEKLTKAENSKLDQMYAHGIISRARRFGLPLYTKYEEHHDNLFLILS